MGENNNGVVAASAGAVTGCINVQYAFKQQEPQTHGHIAALMHTRTLYSGNARARAVMLVHLFAGWRRWVGFCNGSDSQHFVLTTLQSADREMLLASSPIWFVYDRKSVQMCTRLLCTDV